MFSRSPVFFESNINPSPDTSNPLCTNKLCVVFSSQWSQTQLGLPRWWTHEGLERHPIQTRPPVCVITVHGQNDSQWKQSWEWRGQPLSESGAPWQHTVWCMERSFSGDSSPPSLPFNELRKGYKSRDPVIEKTTKRYMADIAVPLERDPFLMTNG